MEAADKEKASVARQWIGQDRVGSSIDYTIHAWKK